MKIAVLNRDAIRQAITMTEAIGAAKEALAAYSAGEADIPLRSGIKISPWQGEALFMPGYARSRDALGIKIVSVYPNNPAKCLPGVPATMVLLDSQTGQVSALMDGTCLTQLRTAAMAGAATDLLARMDAENFLLIGTGGQARQQLEAILAVRPIKTVGIYSRNPQHVRAFFQSLPDYPGVTLRSVEDLSEAVGQADILTTVTTALEPVFPGSSLRPGTHINAMGSFTPQMSEVPEAVLHKAAKLYVDTGDAFTESGNFQKPLARGSFARERLTGELGELINGTIPGRESPEEITFFGSTGNAILDLVTARLVFDKALSLGLGSWIDL